MRTKRTTCAWVSIYFSYFTLPYFISNENVTGFQTLEINEYVNIQSPKGIKEQQQRRNETLNNHGVNEKSRMT